MTNDINMTNDATNDATTTTTTKKRNTRRRTKRETISSVAIAKRMNIDAKTMRARVRRHETNIAKKCRVPDERHVFYVDQIDALFDALKFDDDARKRFAKTS